MTAQFSHWTNADIVDRFLEGHSFAWIAARAGMTIWDVRGIVTKRDKREPEPKGPIARQKLGARACQSLPNRITLRHNHKPKE